MESKLLPRVRYWCPTCNKAQKVYAAAEGDSAPVGSICCGTCQRVILRKEKIEG